MTSKPPIPYEKAIGAFNDSELATGGIIRPDPGRIWIFPRERFYPASWFRSGRPDSEVRPNAWPRFSLWPFRLRRGGRQ